MSRTNETGGEFQRVWGVPVMFTVLLWVLCGLSPNQ